MLELELLIKTIEDKFVLFYLIMEQKILKLKNMTESLKLLSKKFNQLKLLKFKL
jgi:hypothetical protein